MTTQDSPPLVGQRLARMFVARMKVRALSSQDVAQAALVFRPSRPISPDDVQTIADGEGHTLPLGGVVMPLGRALGLSRREVTLARKLDVAERTIDDVRRRAASPTRPRMTVCRFPDRPHGMISALGRSYVPLGKPETRPIPDGLAAAVDFGELLAWAAGLCLHEDAHGWLEWNQMLRFKLAPDGRATPELAPVVAGRNPAFPAWGG